MRLEYRCTQCKAYNKLDSNAHTRSELHQKHGETVSARCMQCPNVNKLGLLDIRAKTSDFYRYLTPLVLLAGLLLGGLFALVMWKVFYFTPRTVLSILVVFVALPLGVSYRLVGAAEESVSRFNRSR